MEVPLFKITREAGADLSAKQFHFVKLNSSSQVIAVAAVTDIPFGVLQNDPDASGKEAEIMVSGVSEIIAGIALTIGTQVTVDNTGRAAVAVAGTDTTKYSVGTVLIGCSNANERVTVLFSCMAPGRAA
jgi:hypothetical protein